jgi:membrane protein required for beta-lactamase induction
LNEYRSYDFFLAYVDWWRERFSGPAWDHVGGLILMLLPLWLGVALLQHWISDWAFGLVGLLFYVAVLVYCLGPRDLAADADTYCHAHESGDDELRRRAAELLLRRGTATQDSAASAHEVSSAVLVEASDRLFAVLFWFALLGPLGAVMYRSVAVLYREHREEGELGDSVAWLHAALVWVPVRLLALGYALSGHFDAAVEGWRDAQQLSLRGSEGSMHLLAVTSTAALGFGEGGGQAGAEQVRAAMRLVWRALAIWMVIIALLTLAGWTT